MARETPLPETTACPRCGGERLVAGVPGRLYRPRPNFGEFAKYLALFNAMSSLRALVCTACGFTELFAQYPERLR